MKRLSLGRAVLVLLLPIAILGGCTSRADKANQTTERPSPSVATSTASTAQTEEPGADEQKVYHRMAVGETVDIHGIRVTVASAKDGPESVDGKRTFVIHVKYQAVPDPSYGSSAGTSFSPMDWALEYTRGELSSEIATVSAAALGDVTLQTGQRTEGDIYLVKKGNVAKVVYTPRMFDWYPEVTTWGVR